jgi:WD40 repeat protein
MFTGGVTWLTGQAASQVLGSYRAAGKDDTRFPPMPQEVAELLRRCFERKPDERPQGMAAVADQLRDCYRGVVGEEYGRAEPKPSELLADALNNRAVSLLDLGRWEAAEKLFEQALQADAHHPEATYNWGLLLWRSGRMTDDVLTKQLEEVRKTHEGDWRDEFYLGLVHMERGDEESALKALELASGQASQEEEVQRALAVVRRSKGEWHSWVRTLEGHTDKLASVTFSRDGSWMLSGSWDNTLRLWELATGQCVRTFKGHTMWVDSVAFSPDGRLGLSGSWDKTLRLWELTTGKCVRTCEGHTNVVTSVSISPDGRWALSGSTDNTLRLWELATGRCVRTFTGHTGFVQSVSTSPDGRWGLSASWDKTLRLWELTTGRCVRTFEAHTAYVKSVSISSDGRRALSGSDDKTLRLWELATGRCVRTFQGHTGFVTSVSISPDGRWALSGSEDKTVRLWELATGQCVRTFEGPKCAVNSVSISPDGRFALAGSGQLGGSAAQLLRALSGLSGTGGISESGSTLWLWELKRCGPPASFAVVRPRSSAEVIRADTVVRRALESAKSALRQNDAPRAAAEVSRARQIPGYERHKELMELWHQTRLRGRPSCFSGGWLHRTFEGHSDEVQSVSISPDGRWALSGSNDKTLRLWELETGSCVRTFKGHEEEVYSVSISPDGRGCLSGSQDKMVRLWDLVTGQHVRTFAGHRCPVNCVSISPDGQWALSGGLDRSLRLWELGTGRCVRTFEGHEDPLLSAVLSVAISPDGRWGLSAKKSKETLRMWDLATGQCVRTFKGHTEFGTSVNISSDGLWALSGSADKTLRLWELATGKCVRTFEGHTSTVTSVCLSPDGRWALSGSGDNTVRLWELATGRCMRTFEGHTSSVNSVSISPDGRWLMSGSGDNTLHLWELDWECEFPAPADWDEGVRPYLKIFLTLHCPCGDDGISRIDTPRWNDKDFARLLTDLQYRGYGWLRSEGVRRELEKMTREWKPL